MQRLEQHIRREVRGEGKRQAELCGELRAIQAGAKQPHRNFLAVARNRAHLRVRVDRVEPVHQFRHIAREVIDIATHMTAQRSHSGLIAARRAAKAEIDTSGIQRIERAELLSDHQRRVVGQHDAAGTEVQGGSVGGQIANQHRSRRAGDAHHIVVFGQPIAVVAALFSELGEVERMGEGFSR